MFLTKSVLCGQDACIYDDNLLSIKQKSMSFLHRGPIVWSTWFLHFMLFVQHSIRGLKYISYSCGFRWYTDSGLWDIYCYILMACRNVSNVTCCRWVPCALLYGGLTRLDGAMGSTLNELLGVGNQRDNNTSNNGSSSSGSSNNNKSQAQL